MKLKSGEVFFLSLLVLVIFFVISILGPWYTYKSTVCDNDADGFSLYFSAKNGGRMLSFSKAEKSLSYNAGMQWGGVGLKDIVELQYYKKDLSVGDFKVIIKDNGWWTSAALKFGEINLECWNSLRFNAGGDFVFKEY